MLFQLMCIRMSQSYNPNIAETILVWALPRSLATTSGIIIIFSSCGYLDVSVPRVRFSLGEISCLQHDGLPHSEIAGSKVVCTYPTLIAAYHVLHRLFEPRHPPSALLLSSFYLYHTVRLAHTVLDLLSLYQYVKDLFYNLRHKPWRIRDSNP